MAKHHNLRLYENYRFLIYAPFYAAHARGAYDAEDLTVDLLPSPGPGHAERALLAGEVDVAWMGPIRVMKAHDEDPRSPLVAFAEVVSRDPFSLVGAKPRPDFRLADLAGLRFASVSEVPTPWLCLEQDLREAGIDPAALARIADRPMPDNVAALAEGRLDVAQLFEPFVEHAVTQGGAVWLPASARGRTAYTVFVTTRGRLEADPEPFRRMVRAMAATQRWLAAASAAEIAETIAGYFPALDRGVLSRALARYQGQGIWAAEPALSEEGFARLGRALTGSGFLRREAAFAACADNSLVVPPR